MPPSAPQRGEARACERSVCACAPVGAPRRAGGGLAREPPAWQPRVGRGVTVREAEQQKQHDTAVQFAEEHLGNLQARHCAFFGAHAAASYRPLLGCTSPAAELYRSFC